MFLVKLSYQKWILFFFQFYSVWLILFKYPYCNRIVIIKVITITGCFAMYSITITITCNHKNQWLQITFQLLKTCNQLHVITITDYNTNRSAFSSPELNSHSISADAVGTVGILVQKRWTIWMILSIVLRQKTLCEILAKLVKRFQRETFKCFTILYMNRAQGQGQITPGEQKFDCN